MYTHTYTNNYIHVRVTLGHMTNAACHMINTTCHMIYSRIYLRIGNAVDSGVDIFKRSVYREGELLNRCIIEGSVEKLTAVWRPPEGVVIRNYLLCKRMRKIVTRTCTL